MKRKKRETKGNKGKNCEQYETVKNKDKQGMHKGKGNVTIYGSPGENGGKQEETG